MDDVTRHVEAAGHPLRLSVLERGGAAPDLVLLLHGLGCVKESMAGAGEAPGLARFRLAAPDLPGSGASPAPPGFPCRMEDFAAAVRALLARLSFRRLHVVAHSMGGAVGLLLAEAGDLPLASFVNVEGNLTADDCGLLSRRAAETPRDVFVDDKFAKIVAKAGGADDPTTRAWAGWMARTDPLAFHRAAVSLVEWSDGGRLLDIFRALSVPKAYVHGERSANPAVIDRLGGIRCVSVPGAGHFVMTDAPDAFFAAVAEVVTAA